MKRTITVDVDELEDYLKGIVHKVEDTYRDEVELMNRRFIARCKDRVLGGDLVEIED